MDEMAEFELSANKGLGSNSTAPVFTSENYPRISSTEYTFHFNKELFQSLFESKTQYSLEQHVKYPREYYSEAELLEKIKSGKLDMAFVEKTKFDNHFDEDLEYTLVAMDVPFLMTSVSNPVESISMEQLYDILVTGKITNWAQLGGTDGRIQLPGKYTGEPDTTFLKLATGMSDLFIGTLTDEQYDAIRPYMDGGTHTPLSGYQETSDYGSLCSVVASIDSEPVSYAGVKSIYIDGVKLTTENVVSCDYPYYMKIYAAYRREHKNAETLKELSIWASRDIWIYNNETFIGNIQNFTDKQMTILDRFYKGEPQQ